MMMEVSRPPEYANTTLLYFFIYITSCGIFITTQHPYAACLIIHHYSRKSRVFRINIHFLCIFVTLPSFFSFLRRKKAIKTKEYTFQGEKSSIFPVSSCLIHFFAAYQMYIYASVFICISDLPFLSRFHCQNTTIQGIKPHLIIPYLFVFCK